MRNKCRFCDNERKEGVKWYDDDYCSGKCARQDGITIAPAAKPDKDDRSPASFGDYLLDWPKKLGEKDGRGQRITGREPKLYRLRCDPEKLNWDEPLSAEQLNQGGFRANREPLPGDWDFAETQDAAPNEWHLLKAKAKALGIATHAKTREQIEAEIQEKENENM